MKVTPNCVIKNHPPGKEFGTVKPDLGAWGTYIRQKDGPCKAIVPLRASHSEKEREKSQEPQITFEKKSHHPPRTLSVGVGKWLKEDVAK